MISTLSLWCNEDEIRRTLCLHRPLGSAASCTISVSGQVYPSFFSLARSYHVHKAENASIKSIATLEPTLVYVHCASTPLFRIVCYDKVSRYRVNFCAPLSEYIFSINFAVSPQNPIFLCFLLFKQTYCVKTEKTLNWKINQVRECI